MKLRGYIHKGYLKEIKVKPPETSTDNSGFWLSKRGLMVWDKRWDDNDIEVVLEVPDK